MILSTFDMDSVFNMASEKRVLWPFLGRCGSIGELSADRSGLVPCSHRTTYWLETIFIEKLSPGAMMHLSFAKSVWFLWERTSPPLLVVLCIPLRRCTDEVNSRIWLLKNVWYLEFFVFMVWNCLVVFRLALVLNSSLDFEFGKKTIFFGAMGS